MKHCEVCGKKYTRRVATLDAPYHDPLIGIPAIYLIGVPIFTCECGEASEIPLLSQLLDTVAFVLIRKPSLLSGEEIRFLRKHAEFPAQEFAKILGVRREHLSRVENGHTETFGASADRLIRVLALRTLDQATVRRLFASLNGKGKVASPEGVTLWLRWNGKRWVIGEDGQDLWRAPAQQDRALWEGVSATA